MKRSFLLFMMLFLTQPILMAQSRIVDPFFLIAYNPREIHFELMPTALPKQCPALRGRYTRAWIYSHLRTEDSEYYILYGYVEAPNARPENGHEVLEEGDGVTIAIRGSTCLMDQTDYFFRQEVNTAREATPIHTSEAALSQLSRDLLQRYVKAFGGKAAFLKFVPPEAVGDLPPALKAQFDVFRNTP